MVNDAQNFIHNWPLITFISSLVTFSLGLFVGHKTALLRDKRKEFNIAATPIRNVLRDQISQIEKSSFTYPRLGKSEFHSLLDVTPKNKQKRLTAAWDAYKKADTECYIAERVAGVERVAFEQPERYLKCAKQLLRFVEPK